MSKAIGMVEFKTTATGITAAYYGKNFRGRAYRSADSLSWKNILRLFLEI